MSTKIPVLADLRERFGLTLKQARFVQELPACDWVAAEAARRAGYSPKRAEVTASELLRREKIQDALSAARADLERQAGARIDDLIREYVAVCYSNIKDITSWNEHGVPKFRPSSELPRHVTAAIRKIRFRERYDRQGNPIRELELEMHSKAKAMEKLGQYLGAWKDPNEVRARILHVFATMAPEDLARIERMDDGEVVDLLQRDGVFQLPPDRDGRNGGG